MEEQTKEVLANNEGSSLEEIHNIKDQPKKKSIKKNYFYNLAYQLFLLIVPLIVTPYVSRVLTPEGVGQYSFSFSLITYFTIVGALGFGNYAQREIAKHQGDVKAQSKSFWEIVICRLIPVAFSLIVNIILCVLKVYDIYTSLMWIFNINIIAIAFDIAFLYQGNEEFGKLVLRNLIVKTISIVLIFLLVKTYDDLWIYTLINAGSVILSNLIMWVVCYKYLAKIKVNILRPLRHLKGTLILFLPTIATSIYTVLDKTLIGLLITDTYKAEIKKTIDGVTIITTVTKKYSDLENGYYEQSEKLIKMAMTIITSIGTVMIPRNSREFASGNIDKVRKNINISSKLVLLFGVPLTLGFISIASMIVPWFFGLRYDKCTILLRILAPLIVIIGFSNVLGLQYLLPCGKDKQFTLALILGSVLNLILNIFFIKIWWSIGAAIATVIAESVVSLVMAIMVRKEVNILKILLGGWKYYISGAIMFLTCYFLSTIFNPTILYTFIVIIIGGFTYFFVLIILREKYIIQAIKKIIVKFIS